QRIGLFLLLAAVVLTVQASLPQEAHAASSVYVASLDQNIDPGAQDFVVSSINDATSSGIHNFILIINTNGGAGVNMENIISAIAEYMGSITPGYRNATGTKMMVTGGKSYSCQTYSSCYAKQQNVIDVVLNVSSTQDALTAMGAAGAPIHTPGVASTFLSIIS